MRVLICDDEPLARDRIKRMLEKITDVEVVGEARNGIDLLDRIPLTQPDVVLTDIRMPAMDGMEAAEHMANMAEPPALIFCTAYDEYAIRAFQVQAIGYLLKPVRQEDLEQALSQARRVNRAQLSAVREGLPEQTSGEPPSSRGRRHISAKTHRGIELIPVDEVRYFMADQKYVTVRYPGGDVLIDDTLKELEEEFGQRFLRVHRNALVALAHIEGLEQHQNQYQLRFKDIEDRVVISRRHVAAVKKLLQRY
ncbi:MAG: LytTR family DNA-binding domain-containing protein [Ketobacteraceae bacterium]|nr:LytTR family DNA-binding domain-containing protein [Ketobacteraceae bacterium]